MKHTESYVTQESLSGDASCFDLCKSAVNASGHVYWSHVPHPPLPQLEDRMDPVPVIFINDSVFMPAPWDYNRLIRSSEEGTASNFSWYLNHFPFA